MTDVINLLFSPIGKEYCGYFKILMYLTFLGAMVTSMGVLTHFFSVKKNRMSHLLPALLAIGQAFLFYFINRLFYSMCVN